MEKKNVFIATVKIAVFADDQSYACDSISACLSENLMGPGPLGSGAIIDWTYLPDLRGGYVSPEDKGLISLPIEEGELFNAFK